MINKLGRSLGMIETSLPKGTKTRITNNKGEAINVKIMETEKQYHKNKKPPRRYTKEEIRHYTAIDLKYIRKIYKISKKENWNNTGKFSKPTICQGSYFMVYYRDVLISAVNCNYECNRPIANWPWTHTRLKFVKV